MARLLRKKRAAVAMDCSTQKIDRLRKNGNLGYVTIGNRVYIPESEVERYVSEHFVPARIDQKMAAAGPDQF